MGFDSFNPARELVIRPLTDRDSLEALTELLHRAYAGLAAMGLQYLATHQSVTVTRERLAAGTCFVALLNEQLVGTIKYSPPGSMTAAPWFEQSHVAHIGQFGIEPDYQRQGIGTRLMAWVERQAIADGATDLALDTAKPAVHLIQWYARLGYREVAQVDWPETNYLSVILSKQLR